MDNGMGSFVILPLDQEGIDSKRPKMTAKNLAPCLDEVTSLKRSGQCSWVIVAYD